MIYCRVVGTLGNGVVMFIRDRGKPGHLVVRMKVVIMTMLAVAGKRHYDFRWPVFSSNFPP